MQEAEFPETDTNYDDSPQYVPFNKPEELKKSQADKRRTAKVKLD